MTNNFTWLLILILFFSCSNERKGSTTKNENKPNIVVILVDDMGFSDLGCYGSEIETPNLDKLAANGVRFNQFFNTSKCFPSRACLLTGMYAQKCGMSESNDSIKNAVTIGEVLKEAGYRTLMVGKHHGLENMYFRGFDRYFGLRDGMCNYFNPGEQREGELPPARKAYDWAYPRNWCIDSVLYSPYTPSEKDFYTTDYFTNYAIDYLEEYKNEDKPFFLYVAYNAPHDPLMAWPEDIQKYIGKYRQGYEMIRQQRYEKQKEIGLIDESFPLSDPTYEEWNSLTENEQLIRDSIMAVYAAMIDRVDQNIGRLITKIEEQGKLENTLIMFMSDNGAQSLSDEKDWYFAQNKISDYSQPIGSMARFTSLNLSWANVSNTPFRYYKDFSHNGGIATPLIINWPSKIKEKNSVSRSRGHFVDILPTILDITGAEYPDKYNNQNILPYDGQSLLPVILEGKEMDNSRPLFFQWGPDQALMRDNWKIVRYNAGPWELYNIDNDKTETNNLAAREKVVLEDMIHQHEEWMSEMSMHLQKK